MVFTIHGHEGHVGHEKTFVPPSHRGATQNLALIGQAVSEKLFEH